MIGNPIPFRKMKYTNRMRTYTKIFTTPTKKKYSYPKWYEVPRYNDDLENMTGSTEGKYQHNTSYNKSHEEEWLREQLYLINKDEIDLKYDINLVDKLSKDMDDLNNIISLNCIVTNHKKKSTLWGWRSDELVDILDDSM